MKNSIVVPFDLNTARKIKSGEIEGSVLINNIEIEFVYESKDCAGPYNLLWPSRGTWSSPVASRAPATSTTVTGFGR